MQHTSLYEQASEHNAVQARDLPKSFELGEDEVFQVDLAQSFLMTSGSDQFAGRYSGGYPGTIVEAGKEVIHLDLTSDPTELGVSVVDIRGTRIHDTDDDNNPVHDVGSLGRDSVMRRGDFALLLHSQDWSRTEVHSLLPGVPLVVGRGSDSEGRPHIGSLTPGLLPNTVSREHCAVSIDESGVLTVESRSPKNRMTMGRPAVDPESFGQEQVLAGRLANVLSRLPETVDKQVLLHNLTMMYGEKSAMSRLLFTESVGGNAGSIKKDGESYSCAGANGYYAQATGKIIVFENIQSIPKLLIRDAKKFTLRVATDIRAKDWLLGVSDIYRSGQHAAAAPSIEMAEDMLEVSVAAYNELKAYS